MTAPVTVREQDLHTLLGIVSDHRSDLPAAGLPPSLLTELMGLVHCDEVNFTGHDSFRQTEWFDQLVPAGSCNGGAGAQVYWEHYWDCDACSYPDRSGDVRSVTRASDFYSVRQWHSTGMYTEYVRPFGIEHEMLLCLPAGPMRTARLIFSRGAGPDFSERDRALLALLRPHLHQAYLDAERHRSSTVRLTPRHWELLRLVAAGHTNAQIGRRLGVTEGTVRKHLENIYTRLQVSSRTAAVTRAFPGGAAETGAALGPVPADSCRRAVMCAPAAGQALPQLRA
jgi:DNA-binding CsgD family transcriptional regulator